MITPLYCRKCGKLIPSDSLFCSACGAPQTGTAHATANQPQQNPSLVSTGRLPAGQMLHKRYRLLQAIGQGGMGAVYAANDTQLGDRLMAVKEMSTSRLKPEEVPQAVEQFRQEAHLLAGLQHPNLPVIHEYFQENGRWYLVMSFIEGQTLQAVLNAAAGNKLPVNEVVRIGIELCNVLDYLHTHNPQIIFRDLKPLNIMLTPKGHLYLIDFGIARHFKQNQPLDTVYYYSAGYAPPEQYGRSQTNPRSDIYSLGVTLHQMLSGHHPADQPFQFAPLQLVNSTLPEPLALLIAQMLKMQEQDRPANIAEVKAQLVRPGQPTAKITLSSSSMPATVRVSETSAPSSFLLAARPEAIEVLHTFTGHTMNVVSVALSANGRMLASASHNGVIKLWNVQTSQNLRTLGTKDVTVASIAMSADGRILASGNSDDVARLWNTQTGNYNEINLYKSVTNVVLSADGLLLASTSYDLGIVYLHNAQTFQHLSTLGGARSSRVTSVTLSANGLTLISGHFDSTIKLWNTQTGRFLYTIEGHKETITNVALSADGLTLASSSHDGTIKLWNVQDAGKLLHTLTSATKSIALSANGLLLASSGYGDGTINLWNTQTGKLLRTLTLPTGSVSSVALSADGLLLASGSSDGTVHVWGVKG